MIIEIKYVVVENKINNSNILSRINSLLLTTYIYRDVNI